MEPENVNDGEKEARSRRADWLRRFVGGLHRRPPAPMQPGHRSGCGADSVKPYLEQDRSSRPAPLE